VCQFCSLSGIRDSSPKTSNYSAILLFRLLNDFDPGFPLGTIPVFFGRGLIVEKNSDNEKRG